MSTTNHALAMRGILLMGAAALALACTNPLEDGENPRIGTIRFYQDPVVITVPDTVDAGETFQVSVRTYGNGCTSLSHTKVRLDGRTVDITPFDLERGAVCADVLAMFDHTATLVIPEAGTARIRFHGWQLPEERVVTETREVVVR